MADGRRYPLAASGHVVLDADGSGSVSLGPDTGGPQTWEISGMVLQTNRPGRAPVPRAQVYLDSATPGNSKGLTYDGSFASGFVTGMLTLTRGQQIIVTWTGGQEGDTATLTVNGEKY